MIPWPLTPRLFAISLAAGMGLAAAASGFVNYKLGQGSQVAATLACQTQVTSSETARANGWEKAVTWYGKANEKAQAAIAETGRLRTRAGDLRRQYEKQLKENPSCAAQDAQPLACQPW